MKIFLFAFIIFFLPAAYAMNASSVSYSIDSFHLGVAGGNASSNNYELRSTTAYEPGNNNGLSYHYAENIGWFLIDNRIVLYVCGNGIVEYGESCDSGSGNGACPKTCSSTCTVNSCSSGGSGGSGGSGSSGVSSGSAAPSGTASTSSSTVINEFVEMPKGENIIKLENTKIAFSQISLSIDSAKKNVKFIISLADGLAYNYPGKVYSFVNVTHDNLNDSEIAGSKIRFKVEKSWISKNANSKNEILLSRYSGTWKDLKTLILSEDSTFVYYEASSPGLSLFAIAIKPVKDTPLVQSNDGDITELGVTEINKRSDANAAESSKLSDYLWPIVFCIIIAAFTIFIIVRMKPEPEDPHIVMQKRLEEWISKEEFVGYTPEQLKKFLLQKGYNARDVDIALKKK